MPLQRFQERRGLSTLPDESQVVLISKNFPDFTSSLEQTQGRRKHMPGSVLSAPDGRGALYGFRQSARNRQADENHRFI